MDVTTKQKHNHSEGIDFDFNSWPIVFVTPTSHLTEQSIQNFFSAYLEVVRNKQERHVIILDFTKNVNLIKKWEKSILGAMKDSKKTTAEYIAGVALVFNSPVIRALSMPFFWLFDPGYPTEICATVEEAIDWCSSRLDT